jgi:exodeoxyribonuclease-3
MGLGAIGEGVVVQDAVYCGRRLDHVWSSPNLVSSFAGYEILRLARGWERPSDHVPVIARFDLD